MERSIDTGPSFPPGTNEWWLSPWDKRTLLAGTVPTAPYLHVLYYQIGAVLLCLRVSLSCLPAIKHSALREAAGKCVRSPRSACGVGVMRGNFCLPGQDRKHCSQSHFSPLRVEFVIVSLGKPFKGHLAYHLPRLEQGVFFHLIILLHLAGGNVLTQPCWNMPAFWCSVSFLLDGRALFIYLFINWLVSYSIYELRTHGCSAGTHCCRDTSCLPQHPF